MSRSTLSEQSMSELHNDWSRDRDQRHLVPLRQGWRGCLGLAALIEDQDETQYHGKLALVRNEQLRWVAMRDVPIGRFPACASMNRRDVCYVNSAVAVLKHGMPVIDFTRNLREAVDFRFRPRPACRHLTNDGSEQWLVASGDVLNSVHYPREFAVYNRIGREMTRFAFAGVRPDGTPLRPAWFRQRPQHVEPFTPPDAADFMPRPYLAFPEATASQLFDLATQHQAQGSTFSCPACRGVFDSSLFTAPECCTRFQEIGDFIAACPCCGARRKRFVDDAVSYRSRRQFTLPFQDAFCDAVARGLPLASVGPSIYLGQLPDSAAGACVERAGRGNPSSPTNCSPWSPASPGGLADPHSPTGSEPSSCVPSR